MKYIDQKADWNKNFENYIKSCLGRIDFDKKFNQESMMTSYVRKYIIDGKVDFNEIIYKKLVDEEETIIIDGKKYTLLPMGLRKGAIPPSFVGADKPDKHVLMTDGRFQEIVIGDKFSLFYYPDDKNEPDFSCFDKVCQSYIDHYQNALGEKWSKKRFYDMIKELKYLSVKYAKDEETGEIFAIGFFGAYLRNGSDGPCLTNAELYVMPEFRGMGIAKRLVGLTFDEALKAGIRGFDSITYRVVMHDALSFWKSIGAVVSGLYHIEGDISEMGKNIEDKIGYKTK